MIPNKHADFDNGFFFLNLTHLQLNEERKAENLAENPKQRAPYNATL